MKESDMLTKFKTWWEGRYVPPDNHPNAEFYFVMGHMERPKVALLIEAIGRWLKENYWKVITVVLAIIGLWINSKR
jgi:hypothetical protein